MPQNKEQWCSNRAQVLSQALNISFRKAYRYAEYEWDHRTEPRFDASDLEFIGDLATEQREQM